MRSFGCIRNSVLSPALSCLALACSAEPPADGAPDLGTGAPRVLTSSSSSASSAGAASTADPADTTAPEEQTTSSSSSPKLGCLGTELQHESGLAASLAVAVANELQRWDVLNDFELQAGKLALSPTGELHCGAGCSNIRALLSLQESAASVVPEHDPLAFRSKLASWYAAQKSALTELMAQKLILDKGVYRLKNRLSNKYMQVDAGSLAENALVEQRTSASQPGSDQWRLVLDHGTHRLINVRSEKCLTLGEDSSAQDVTLVQQTCSGSALQRFGFAKSFDHYALLSKTGQSLRVRDYSTLDDTPLVQGAADLSQFGQHWALEAVGAGALAPDVVADGMYTVVAVHSGKSITVDSDNSGENAAVEQETFSATDDRYQWYLARGVDDKFMFLNRRTGKCLDLEATDTASRLLQRTCSGAETQLFTLNAAGDGSHVIYSLPGNAVEVGGSGDRAQLALGSDTSWNDQRRFTLTPVLGTEPHRLSSSQATDEGPCGDFRWYDMQQPSGQPLRAPGDAFVQLMFAGGRRTPDGQDENPYLEQLPSSARVALAPLSPLNGERGTGSCVASDLLYDPTGAAEGDCCSKSSGGTGQLELASWSSTLYLCR